MISHASDPKRHPKQVIVLITSVIIGFSCFLPIDLYLPSLPHIVTALSATTDQVQHSVTFFLLGLGATQLIFGPLSDRFGRKPILLFGLCITTAGSITIVFCHSPEMFLAGRFIQGVGAGSGAEEPPPPPHATSMVAPKIIKKIFLIVFMKDPLS